MKKINLKNKVFIGINFLLIVFFVKSLSWNTFQERIETYAYVRDVFINPLECNSLLPERFHYLFFRNGYYIYSENISKFETKWVKIPQSLKNYLDDSSLKEEKTLDSLIKFTKCFKRE